MGEHADARRSGRQRIADWAEAGGIGRWRVLVPVAAAAAGLMGVTSMLNSHGTDLRSSRDATSLVGIVSAQRSDNVALLREIRTVRTEIELLTDNVTGGRVARTRGQIDKISPDAGFTAMSGPGLAVTLDDAPLDVEPPPGVDENRLVVHQQDIQSVVNALWAGGAEAISLQGQRLVSTTGIKCVGNTVLLQGVPYSPPYRIVAIGDTAQMFEALEADPNVSSYRADADYLGLGWRLRSVTEATVPAFTGTAPLDFAAPLNAGR